MHPQPLVTIIIIFYNAERFFQEAVESVLAQTYTNWELLLVDDGTSDSSKEMAEHYVVKHPDKIRYLQHAHHQNRGMSATRNLGIREAKGKYIAFLDADDVWLPSKLEEQVKLLEAQPKADMTYGRALYWYSWTGIEADQEKDYRPTLSISPDQIYSPPELLLYNYPLGISTAPCPSEMLIRRSLVEQVDGFEESFIKEFQYYEDQPFLAKVYLNGNVLVTDKTWIKYRIHPDSISSKVQAAKRYKQVRRYHLNWLKTHLAGREIDIPGVNQKIEEALRRMKVNSFRTKVIKSMRAAGKKFLPKNWYINIRSQFKQHRKRSNTPVNFGDLRRLKPVSNRFGFDRGLPIDRYYIENFLDRYASDIRGNVLEIGDNDYTVRFGEEKVIQSDILHVVEGNPSATFIGDLTQADHIPSDRFDCIILTQTLHLIYNLQSALSTLHRILKPGGVLLATFPGISQMEESNWGSDWYWGFTNQSARRLFGEVFLPEQVEVNAHGNVLAATAFLQGLAAHELKKEELDYRDKAYDLLITVKATK